MLFSDFGKQMHGVGSNPYFALRRRSKKTQGVILLAPFPVKTYSEVVSESALHPQIVGSLKCEVARELKIKDNTLYGWMKKYSGEPEIVAAQAFKSEDHQLRELQKQIRDLQEENEILKKAMHFFAKDRR
ncbi:transposase [Paenibacillus phoenicis]|uniref:Transposase n=1 Tax=Paenibacillus phoenicis TaxID=554117 RepID=A0ABU5PRR3_9BACL|nr:MULTISPECIES: transposase [Paenibacillus]MEA3572601.1 transposase [Paenibacillus phoenicis]MEC2343071.1 transposase [Paenibacillus barengoltzii]